MVRGELQWKTIIIKKNKRFTLTLLTMALIVESASLVANAADPRNLGIAKDVISTESQKNY